MRIYHADLNLKAFLKYLELFPDRRINLLLSFGNITQDDYEYMKVHSKHLNNSLQDSGVWTANFAKPERRKKITLLTYLYHLKLYYNCFDDIFNFDIDFSENGFETNLNNQLFLEKNGFNPIPVIHSYSPNEVNYYIDRGYDFIAIGSSQVKNNYTMLSALVWRLYYENIKVHLFGTAKYEYIATLPIFSCDTTNWSHSATRGYIYYWNENKVTYQDKTDIIFFEDHFLMDYERNYYVNYKYRSEFEKYLKDNFNMSISNLVCGDGKLNKNIFRFVVNINYFYNLERYITEIQKDSGIIFHKNGAEIV